MNKWFRLIRYDWPLHFVLVLTNWLPDNIFFIKMRGFLAKPFFKKAGTNIQIGRDVTFYDPSKISIGNHVYIAKGCWFCAGEEIIIDDKILFGPYVIIVTAYHSLLNGNYYDGPNQNSKKVTIGYGSWIGAHVTILPGSEIAKASLIAANSVFSGKNEDFSIYRGIPAKFIKYADKK